MKCKKILQLYNLVFLIMLIAPPTLREVHNPLDAAIGIKNAFFVSGLMWISAYMFYKEIPLYYNPVVVTPISVLLYKEFYYLKRSL